jgi:hypothetical protein
MVTSIGSFTDALAFGALNDVLSIFHEDNAYGRPNQYEVQILPPPGKLQGHDFRSISLKAESVLMPGRSVQTQPKSADQLYGPTRELITGPTYADEVTMTIQSPNGLDERMMLEKWQELSFSNNTYDVAYYNEYVGTLNIHLLDMNDRKTFGLQLKECFPKTITGVNLAYGPNTEIIKTNVAWTFREWTNLMLESQSQSLAEKLTDTVTNTVERAITANVPSVLRRLS